MRTSKLIGHLAVFALLLGCASSTPADAAAKVNLAKEEAAIRDTDVQWLAAAKSRDVEKSISFWTDDATILQPDTPPITGKAAIRKYVAEAFASPDFSINFAPETIIVDPAGTMAYEIGHDTMTFRGPGGKVITAHTQGVVVWRKQPDGAWKAAVDIWNAAPSAAAKAR
jgi:ketosteroid isomerase-like protein